MTAAGMHADELRTDAALVRRLLAAQFPRWAALPIAPVPSAGTDNALYRLGEGMVVRLPRAPWAFGQVEKEQRWLPELAPHLPVAIPRPLAQGRPGEGYPWAWSIYGWLDGENATAGRIKDPIRVATDLAAFIVALQRIDATDGPPPGAHNGDRGRPLALRDAFTRAAIAELRDELDTDAATAAWEAAISAPEWIGPGVWIHADLHPGNLLAHQGRLSAVIDWGLLAVGDPACDVAAAWTCLSAAGRRAFRAALPVDAATWARGRGWALLWLAAVAHYRETNPLLAAIGRHAVEQVLADGEEGA